MVIKTLNLIKKQINISKAGNVLTINKSLELTLDIVPFLIIFSPGLLCSVVSILSFHNFMDYEIARIILAVFLLVALIFLIIAVIVSFKYYSSSKYIFDKQSKKFTIIKPQLNIFKKDIRIYPLAMIKHIYYNKGSLMLLMDNQEAKILTIDDIKLVEKIINELDEFLNLSDLDFDTSKLKPEIRNSIEIKRLEKLLKIKTRDDQLYFKLGEMYFSEKSYDKAIDSYEKAIEVNNRNPQYYEKLGKALIIQDKYQVALDAYKVAISRFPDYFVFYRDSGFIYDIYIRDLSKAEYFYEKALNIALAEEKATADQPVISLDNKFNVLTHLAEIYKRNKKYNQAIKCFNRLIEMDEKKYNPYFSLGEIYYSQKNYKQAEQFFERVGALNVDDSYVQIKLATFYFEIGKEEKAIQHLKLAVKASVEIENRDVYNEYKRNPIIQKLFKRALEVDPEARKYLARYL